MQSSAPTDLNASLCLVFALTPEQSAMKHHLLLMLSSAELGSQQPPPPITDQSGFTLTTPGIIELNCTSICSQAPPELQQHYIVFLQEITGLS